MGKIQQIKSAHKEHKCSKCGRVIAVGEPYLKGVINFHPDIVRCPKCGLQSWEVTTSDYQLSVGEILYRWKDTYTIDEELPSALSSDLQDILDEQQERLDNMPENLQYSETGELLQSRIDSLETTINELDAIDMDELKGEAVSTVVSQSDELEEDAGYTYDELWDNHEDIRDSLESELDAAVSNAVEEALGNLEM